MSPNPKKLRLRDWLIQQANKNEGASYYDDRDRNLIKIPWVHGSKKHWDSNVHCRIFKLWAEYSGRFIVIIIINKKDPKIWKSNFRCALNSLSDVKEVKELSRIQNGVEGYKVYKIIKGRKSSNHNNNNNNA
ncbi:hypothetical protein HELRODRAFT_65913 [Helobdella robusta]|uniref:IRF tryptophan pentad repeat domain-containing protein n=1 Tax=Helobdella robusta TaxID=6412 RepID=T1FYE3_HELRO|nr:hypothetical protein HELRODRAFT_65913 [Helobdella robusta]ESO02683.1 hypothetical protein HELRODRAFT_65913 [Helobdella robusta]